MAKERKAGSSDRAGPEKERALSAALAQIERQFGKGSMMRLGAKELGHRTVDLNVFGLDVALGIGGLPKGRVVEIYGPESSGKTTLTLQVIAEAQKRWHLCLHRRGARARSNLCPGPGRRHRRPSGFATRHRGAGS